MPKAKRVKGYHYAYRTDGSKYRVYSNSKKRSSSKGRTKHTSTYSKGYGVKKYPVSTGADVRRTRAPSSRGLQTQTPSLRSTGRDGGVIVSHREYIADIPSSTSFRTLELQLNPGIKDTFPWLARVAQNFEEYVPRAMMFEFRTTSSDTLIANSPALGSVIMTTQYNALSPDFASKQEMENYEGAVSCKPSLSCKHYVQCSKRKNVLSELYIRTAPPNTGADLRLYDLGRFSMGVVGMQTDDDIIGELWVSYEMELRKPRIPSDPLSGFAQFKLTGVNQTAAQPFGSDGQITNPTYGSTLKDIQIKGGGATGLVQFGSTESGYFLIQISTIWGVTSTVGTWSISNLQNCLSVAAFSPAFSNIAFANTDGATSTSTRGFLTFVINITGPNASFTVTNGSKDGGNNATAISSGDVIISEIPDTVRATAPE